MSFAPKPYFENPNLRTPISFIVDDPAPCINPLWFYRHQVDKQPSPNHERTIPIGFMEKWCRFVADSRIRGDFTILPYPAGLGRIDHHLEGFDDGEVRAWLDLARAAIMPRFDIHCEILTHTLALDLKSGKMLGDSEQDWMMKQDERALTDYFAAAMQILKDAGVPNNGVTQPVVYFGDESMYARALLAAEKRVNNRRLAHNFVYWDTDSPTVPPRITYLDANAGEAVVSVWTGIVDPAWDAQERDKPEREFTPDALADRCVTIDGTRGRLAELMAGGGPIVLVTHWQTLYSNGTELGIAAYKEAIARVESLWGERVAWRKVSDLARDFLAASTAVCVSRATAGVCEVEISGPFATDVITVSIPAPWMLTTSPAVALDGQPIAEAVDQKSLDVNKWLRRGSLITVSLSLERNAPRTISITPRA